jgi:putative transposase
VLTRSGQLSNSAKGNPYDNANMESFFKTYKSEEANLAQYESLEELRINLELFLQDYNSQRLHSSLGYCSPIEFEQLHAERKAQVCVR